jgi:ubiquitin-protein ligase
MIEFKCPQCHSSFSVPETLAGRRARCKKCATPITIPALEQQAEVAAMIAAQAAPTSEPGSAASAAAAPSQPAASPPVPAQSDPSPVGPSTRSDPIAPSPVTAAMPTGPRLPPRVRRLKADAEQMRQAFDHFPLIKIRSMLGDPPDVYEIEYYVKGLERIPGRKEPFERNYHTVEIKLNSDYPRMGPACKMLTPIFHPNIEPASICVGDHWTAGERLVDLVIRIGEMIAYQAYNIKSPLDAEAAMWADLNMRNLPIDDRNMRPPELD